MAIACGLADCSGLCYLDSFGVSSVFACVDTVGGQRATTNLRLAMRQVKGRRVE